MKKLLQSVAVPLVVVVGLGLFLVISMSTTINYNLANTVESVRSSVVHIEKVGQWQGSGFILTSDGVIVTAKHVVEGGGQFVVTLDDGTMYTTDLVASYKYADIGFLKIKPDKPLKAVQLDLIKDWRVGNSVFIMGSPLGKDNFNSVTLGIISAAQRNLDVPDDYGYGWKVTFQSDSPAYPGNSGGPVFNMNGRVIGVLVAGMDASLNYSVPVFVFTPDLNAIIRHMRELPIQTLVPEPLTNPEPDYLSMILDLQEQVKNLTDSNLLLSKNNNDLQTLFTCNISELREDIDLITCVLSDVVIKTDVLGDVVIKGCGKCH